MSMTVCQQGVNSGFGPWLGEPRVLGFEFSISSRRPLRPPLAEDLNMNFHGKQQEFGNDCLQNLITQQNKSEPEFNNELNRKNSAKNEGTGGGGWSFLQALSDATQGEKKGENEEVYVHPLAKQSASMLSEKSLEMCTESLGSETGSDMSENGDELMSSLAGSETERSPRMPCFGVRKRFSRVDSFPPPLTTISRGSYGGGCGSGGGRGGCGFQVMSQREEGRLVIKAVSVGTHRSCFKAERRDGRLRLHFMESFDDEYEGNDEFEDGGCEEEGEFDHENDEDEVELGNLGRSRPQGGAKKKVVVEN